MGKLIVVEGLDGSGKSTQIEKIKEYFTLKNTQFRQIKLPDYDDPSSTLVKMYLGGEFGSDPSSVNAYTASSFYATDRAASYLRHWRNDYLNGKIILADRYTTSNAVHQTCKLDKNQWTSYLDWLYDFEFNLLKIPKPDLVLYLDMEIEASQKLLEKRYEGDNSKKDIHESNTMYLNECREAALFAADRLGWSVIKCSVDNIPLGVEEIFAQITSLLDLI